MSATPSYSTSKFADLALAAVILYFAWQAADALTYWGNVADNALRSNKQGWEWLMWQAISLSRLGLVILSVALPVCVWLVSEDDASGATVFWLLVWAVLGWWIGRTYAEAAARQADCKANSTFGFGCSLDSPVFSVIGFSAVTCLLVIIVSLDVLGAISKRMSSK